MTSQHPPSSAITAAAAAAAAAATGLIIWYCHRRRHGGQEEERGEPPTSALATRIAELEASVEKYKGLRQAERSGRTRAEARLRELQLLASSTATASAADAPPSSSADVPPLRPIGRLRSVFAGRNGTPRQPLRLAPSARAVLQLDAWVPAASLEGLEQYSHVWLIYAFHANTDAGKKAAAAAAGGGGAGNGGGGGGGSNGGASSFNPARKGAAFPPPSFRAKIHVPRLDGGRAGVLATRSPHRPCPVGLSACRLLAVLPGGRLLLGGADVVDGTPVLDVKPYVPFCDAVEGAEAPLWVAAEATGRSGGGGGGNGNGDGDGNGPMPPAQAKTNGAPKPSQPPAPPPDGEPLRMSEVVLGGEARARLHRAWEAVAGRARDGTRRGAAWRRPPLLPQQLRQQREEGAGRGSLYDAADELERLVVEVLSRDIRSAHQRLLGKAAAAAAAAAATAAGGAGAAAAAGGTHHADEDGDDGRWHVVLDGVDISYSVDVKGRVVIRNAKRAAAFGADGGDEGDEGGGGDGGGGGDEEEEDGGGGAAA